MTHLGTATPRFYTQILFPEGIGVLVSLGDGGRKGNPA